MDVFIPPFEITVTLVFKLGIVMFVSLFGIELLMQMGVMRYLKPAGRPVAKIARLPAESAVCLLAAFGSMIAAHTTAARFHENNVLDDRQLILTGVLNTVPFHFKETLTFQLPVVLPLLGFKLCMIYIAAFWLTGCIKIILIIFLGRFLKRPVPDDGSAFDAHECAPDDLDCQNRGFTKLLADTWHARKKLFIRMLSTLFIITLLIQTLIATGLLERMEIFISPFTGLFNLPAEVVGPISAYIFSPSAGIVYMSNLLNQSLVTPYQATVALMAGSLIMIPMTRIRRTLPRYLAIFGLKNGSIICGVTMGLAMFSRVIILVFILLWYQ